MAGIPSGNITFMFSDVEGSTLLAQQFGKIYKDLLDKHNLILRNAFDKCHGHVFYTSHETFCVAFGSTAEAVSAAVLIQEGISKEDWEGADIRVRIGIHSGYAEWSGKNYMGYLTLARTNRIMSAAHGGQIVASQKAIDGYEQNDLISTVEELAGSKIEIRDLGERRLKDLIEPVRLYQMTTPGIQNVFPPLKSLDARPNNLPVQLSSFIGREKDTERVRRSIDDSRLVTVLGPGGTGKTRLVLQVAADLIDHCANGVWLIDVGPLTQRLQIIQEMEKTFEVMTLSGQNPERSLMEYLSQKELLLIFDNCEHLIDESASLAEQILGSSHKVRIIATSRETLKCDGELTCKIDPLPYPGENETPDPEELVRYDSVRLFIERALEAFPGFRVNDSNAKELAYICFQLEGIPLAIELAAARLSALSLSEIASRIRNRFSLLTKGKRTSLPRQKTLKAAIDWSYDLMTESEKLLWNRLSVFSGGWTIECAEKVCADDKLDEYEILDTMEKLVEKSVASYSSVDQRFRFLETIRQYGREKLEEADETFELYNRHLDYFLEWCELNQQGYIGTDSHNLLLKTDLEHANIRSAISWSLETGQVEKSCRLICALGKFWELRGYIFEGIQWIEKAGELTAEPEDKLKAQIFKLRGIFLNITGENYSSARFLRKALDIFEELNDKVGISQTLNVLGLVLIDNGDYEESEECLLRSLKLKRETGIRIGICSSLNSLGVLLNQLGRYDEALLYYAEALSIAEELNDEIYRGILYNNIAEIHGQKGDIVLASEYFIKGLEIDRKLDNRTGLCISLTNLGNVSLKSGETESAQKYFEESFMISEETGFTLGLLYSRIGLAQIHLHRNEYNNAWRIFLNVLSDHKESADAKCTLNSLQGLAAVCFRTGYFEDAAVIIGVISEYSSLTGIVSDPEINDSIKELTDDLKSKMSYEVFREKISTGEKLNLNELTVRLLQTQESLKFFESE